MAIRIAAALLLHCAVGLVQAEIKVSLVASPTGAGVVVAAASASAPARGALLVAVDGLAPAVRPIEGTAGYLSAPRDLAQAAGTALNISFDDPPLALLPNGAQRQWLLPFKVLDMPAGADLTRYLGFKLGGVDQTLAYRLTSPAATPSTWALKPVPVADRAITPGGGVPLGITVTGAQGVRGLRLGPVELVEQGTKRTLADARLALCPTKAPCAGQAIDRDGNALHTLWLMPLDSGGKGGPAAQLGPGKYVGSVTIASHDKPGGETVNLSVQVSAFGWRLLGVGVIFIGVALAWLSTVYLRYRANRNQMLLPALVWAETASRVRAEHASLALQARLDAVPRRLNKIDAALSDGPLERQGLPPPMPMPGSVSISSTALEAYRAYLDGVGAWVSAVQLIVADGLQPLQSRRGALARQGPQHLGALDDALGALDALADSTTPPVPATVAQAVAQIIDTFEDTLATLDASAAGRRAAGTTTARSTAARPRPSPDQLRLQIAAQGMASWAFILATTLVAGSYMLVFRNPGFGTHLDLLEALLWGLGLPAAAQLTAATTTPSTITTSFSVQR